MSKLSAIECDVIIGQVRAVAIMAMGISDEEIEAMSRQISMEDSVAALFEPSGWIRTHEKSENFYRLFAAFRTFRATVLNVQQAEQQRVLKP